MAQAPTSLRAGAITILLGNGVFNAARLAAYAILAKTTSKQIVGQFETGTAIAAPIVLLLSLELRSAYVADPQDRTPFGAYRVLRFIGLGLALLICFGIVAARSAEESAAMIAILAGAVLVKVAFHSAEIYWGVFQKRERLDLLARSNAIRGGIMLVAFAAILVPLVWIETAPAEITTERRQWFAAAAIWTAAMAWLAAGWFGDRVRAISIGKLDLCWTKAQAAALALRAMPLGIVALLISLCENAPRLFIRTQSEGLEALGQYGALAQIPMIASFIIVQVGVAASNRLARQYDGARRAFAVLTGKLTLFAVVLAVAVYATAWLFGDWLVRTVYTEQYAGHFDAFMTLVAAQCVILLASIFGYITTQMRLFWIQVPIHVAVLTGTLIAAAILVPDDPVNGGATAMLVRAGIQTVLYAACLAYGLLRR